MRLRFDLVDVFTDRAFAGNQLAVVHGADHLSTGQCRAIAAEFNFSETTFPASRASGADEYAVRIFTPGGEIPFAGHPTLGTAWVLRGHRLLSGGRVTQHCAAGDIGVRFASDDDDTLVELSAAPRDLVGPLDTGLVEQLLVDVGLVASDLAGKVWAAGCGLTFVHLPVRADAITRARPSARPLREYADRFAAHGATRDPIEGLNVFAVPRSAPSLRVRSRVFVPGLSVAEDPATGSAAVGLGMALVASGDLPEGGRYDIVQGVELGRPSLLHGRVETAADDRPGSSTRNSDRELSPLATVCHVAGGVRHIGRGEIEVPPHG